MSKLKAIGSEKLQGDEKIKRILEIARYKETTPNSVNETSSVNYNVKLSDGNNYEIVKEKLGYIIKKTVNEGVSEYIEPMKNRKYYSSYSAAFKKLNLMAGELNRINNVSEGISLFTEQKKYTLKTPKPEPAPMPETEPAPAPAPMPEPAPAEDTTDLGPTPPADLEFPTDAPEPPSDEMPDDSGPDMGDEGKDEVVTFKSIQKLTGKLGQKIRNYSTENELTSKDIKYVINSIISAFDLDSLDDEDKEEILSRFEESEEFTGDEMDTDNEDMSSEDGGGDEMDLDMDLGSDLEPSEEMNEDWNEGEEMNEDKFLGKVFDNIFKESKIEKVLSKYFVVNENENKFIKKKTKLVENVVSKKIKNNNRQIEKLALTESQKDVAKKLVSNYPSIDFIGRTNKGNLVFENKTKQLKVSPNGTIL
jgi:hypothetical protein